MDIWNAYLDHFSKSFPTNSVRQGCEPRIASSGPSKNGIVLIHGLTDSPHFMRAIGEHFVSYGFNVYLPLLQCHGLKNPNGMRGVSLDEWKKNVTYAVDQCKNDCEQVSIGGLSTGGALSVWKALTDQASINGGIFLFSAALDLAGRIGNFKEWLLRSFIGKAKDFFDDVDKALIGRNPYRYDRIDVGGARELSELIEQLDRLTGARGRKHPVAQPVFIAHSACDETADIEGAKEFFDVCAPDRRQFYKMCTKESVKAGEPDDIAHAEVVLQKAVKDRFERVLENHNPQFGDMMAEIKEFVDQHLH